jgi:hypothetical protein
MLMTLTARLAAGAEMRVVHGIAVKMLANLFEINKERNDIASSAFLSSARSVGTARLSRDWPFPDVLPLFPVRRQVIPLLPVIYGIVSAPKTWPPLHGHFCARCSARGDNKFTIGVAGPAIRDSLIFGIFPLSHLRNRPNG